MIYRLILFTILYFSMQACGQGKKANEEPYTNSLINESSPYLLEHAHNPVNWNPWNEQTLQKAKNESKPIIISIGYAACHWCHVMERETFSDTAVANFMNANFIAIKVDREERPDVDQVYMNAAQLISGRGGWPLNAFALPDGKPFYAGTYFPKENWMQLLEQIVKLYKNDKNKLIEQAEAITEGIRSHELISTKEDRDRELNLNEYKELFSSWKKIIDTTWGGFQRAPKFPLPVGWEFLLQYHYITKDQQALDAVTTTLDKMAMGGIYDQISGGFARYSTDEYWKVPHFEKMLYDNGQLVSLYAHAYQVTHKKQYADVIEETLAFVERELATKEGAFYSSLNADSEGEEGKFYVWTEEEIKNTLGTKAKLLLEYYQVSRAGNWEGGKNILYPKLTKAEFSRKHNMTDESFDNMLISANQELLKVRSSRIRPTTDDKIITAWNALMLTGYIDAYRALEKPSYLNKALANARFLEQKMFDGNKGLFRNYKNGKASIPAFLDDYALLANAFLELYEVTFDLHWLEKANELATYALNHFYDEKSSMFFYTSDVSEELIARKMEITDNVIPASNSVLAHNLYRLGLYYDNENFLSISRAMLANVQKEIPGNGPHYANWALLLGLMTKEPFEIAIMGDESVKKSNELQRQYLPTSLFMGGKEENLSLLEMKLVKGKTIIYVCQNKVCKLPVTEVSEALKLTVQYSGQQ